MTEERKQRMLHVLDHRQQNITVVMENIFDPHNVFAIMRTCDAVGIQDVYIISTKMPKHKKAGKGSARSANKWVTAHHFTDTKACIAELRNHYTKILSTRFGDNTINVFDIDFTENIALVFGNEQHGVSDELCSLCDGNFLIPQIGMIPSLNVSVACAVTLYEAFRQKSMAGHYASPSLPVERKQGLLNEWGVFES